MVPLILVLINWPFHLLIGDGYAVSSYVPQRAAACITLHRALHQQEGSDMLLRMLWDLRKETPNCL
jgi:hypothetical protein